MTVTLPDEDMARHTKPFIEHLQDLRRAILISVACLGIGMVAVIPLAPRILRLLSGPVAKAGLDPGHFLQAIQVTSGVSVAMRLVFWSALLVSAPGILSATVWFVFPALTRLERRVAVAGMGAAAVLFASGVLLGYHILPFTIRWLIGFNMWMGVRFEWVELADYVSFVLRLLLAFGLACELPIVLLALGWIGVVSADGLARYRRHAAVALLALGAALTPPDVLSQVLLAVPMMGLYEACIWILRWKEGRRSDASGRKTL